MAAVSEVGGPAHKLIRDPNFIQNRVFLANLPICTREEMESICHSYGTVLASLKQKSFGFVQFESEDVANKVASALNGSTFKGNIITVRNAGAVQRPPMKRPAPSQMPMPLDPQALPMQHLPPAEPDHNDCEIIVLDRRNTKYAEFIEQRLKRLHMNVDLLFPNEDVPLGKVLSSISSRRCLYAVLVTSQHQEHNSITVNILYGVPAEHRNMPVEDAIALISSDFRRKLALEGNTRLPQRVMRPNPNYLQPAPGLNGRHPENIQVLINLLADNMRLTVLQLNCVIKYLQEMRDEQMQIELGSVNAAGVPDETIAGKKTPDPEIELQKRILNILSKPSVAETHYPLMYPSLEAVKQDSGLMNLLRDERIQRAIDSLMDSNLVATVENAMKF